MLSLLILTAEYDGDERTKNKIILFKYARNSVCGDNPQYFNLNIFLQTKFKQ